LHLVVALMLGAACLGTSVREAPSSGPADQTASEAGRNDAPDRAADAAQTGQPIPAATAPAGSAVAPDSTPPASAEVPAAAGGGRAAESGAQTEPPAAVAAPERFLHPFQPANGRQRVVVLDPGHGGEEVGAAGAGVTEKDINLTIARTLKGLLEQDGIRVILTRDADRRAEPPLPPTGGNQRATRLDLQARIDIANGAQADVFLSIHNNGSPNPADAGTEVWWDSKRPWAAYNQALAEQTQAALLEAIRGQGYPTINRGLKEDSQFRVFQGRSFPIFVLGPPRVGSSTSRATQMPAVLGEALFLSNAAEAPWLARADMQAAIARGYHEALRRYFRLIDEGHLALPREGLPVETPNHYDTTPPGPANPGAQSGTVTPR
jgi:N-acetylmuramoyl-L-alanine amidase